MSKEKAQAAEEKSASKSESKKSKKSAKSGKKASAKASSKAKAKKKKGESKGPVLAKLCGRTTFVGGNTRPQQWYVLDLSGQVLGQAACRIAEALKGKLRPEYHPSQEFGDHVVVINAEKVKLTGQKLLKKMYYRHSGYLGHLRSESAGQLLQRRPEQLIELAVKGMLTNHRLGRKQLKKLYVYKGSEHPHKAQNPQVLSMGATNG